MATYNNDQFYRIAGIDKPLASDTELTADEYSNPPFIWPGPTRQHYSGNGVWSTKNVERGFIRMLTMTKGGTASEEMKKRRCFFQFNPATIVRQVSMRSDMANVMLQDPSQFSVPVPGDTDFAFEIMFDRSFELNSPPATSTVNYTSAGGSADTLERYGAAGFDALLNASPSEVGVLADLRILDTIIGQGISEDAIAYILERGEIINSYNTSDTTVDVTTDEDTGETTEESTTTSTSPVDSTSPSWDSATAGRFLSRNIGNQAFLIPNPVRVLFSSLFMVDGYVKSVTVNFVKFNEAMVPSQCIIGVQMQALYLGFARKETYLTYALSEAVPQDPVSSTDPVVIDKSGSDFLISLIDNNLPNFRITASQQYTGSDDTLSVNWDSSSYINLSPDPSSYTWVRDGYIDSGRIGFPGTTAEGVQLVAQTPLWGRIPYIFGKPQVGFLYGFILPEDISEDPIANLGFSQEAGFFFNYDFTLEVWRNPNHPNLGIPEQYFPPNSQTATNIPANTKISLFKVSASHSATTVDSWDDARRVKARLNNESLAEGGDSWNRIYRIQFPIGTYTTNEVDMDALKTQWKSGGKGNQIVKTLPCNLTIRVNGSVGDTRGNVVYFRGQKDAPITANSAFNFQVNIEAIKAATG